jgi:hypothetical protein
VVEVSWARAQAERLLVPLGVRWAHTVAVAGQAERLRPAFEEREADHLVAAAYLHDIGYAPELAHTGFHPLDGAFWLTGLAEPEIVALVAHHSCAWVEADARGVGADLDGLPRPNLDVLDALTYCDMTSGPDGQLVTLAQRLVEVKSRYGPGHLVTQSIEAAADYLRDAVGRAETRAGQILAVQPR